MNKKIVAAITALFLTFYGVTGFWANIGNETVNSFLFATMIAALGLAPIAIAISAHHWTRDKKISSMVKSGIICLVSSAVSFGGMMLWLVNSERINIGKMYAIVGGMILSLGTLLIVYSAALFIFAKLKRSKT